MDKGVRTFPKSDAEVKIRPYTGKPTFFDQIITSLVTVTAGFLLATSYNGAPTF